MVRPNQGLILPGQIEVIQIVLIDKDALELLRTYQTLGMAALEQGGNKDKFLIQSTTVSLQDAQTKYTSYDAITTLWSSSNSHHTHAMANKKLHVRYHIHSVSSNHTTATDPTTTPTMHNRTAVMTAPSTQPLSSNNNNYNNTLPVSSSSTDPNHINNNNNSMTKEQLLMDVQNIRRKYDELIAFSVNLTAERDLISNTLEVTKRDYKQLQSQSSQQQRFKSSTHQSAAVSTTTNRIRFFTHVVGIAMMMLLCSLVSLSFGIYIAQQQQQEEDPSIYRIPLVLQPIVQYMVQMISTLLTSTTSNMTHTQLLLNADDTTTMTTTTNDEF